MKRPGPLEPETMSRTLAANLGRKRSQLLKNLQHFVVAVEEGSFHKAADRLNIVQSALSRRIGELETHLGGRLFEREHSGVSLTDAGRALFDDANRIMRELDLAIRRFELVNGGHVSLLRVGFNGASMMHPPVPVGLQQFRHDNPQVELRLTPMLSEQVFQALANGQIDIGIAYEFNQAPTLAARELAVDALALALPRHHVLAAKPDLAVEDLDGCDFIGMNLSASGLLDEMAAKALRARNVTTRIVLEAGSTEATLSLVAAGLGIAFINRSQQGRQPPNVVIRDVTGFEVPLPLKLFWPKATETPILLRFVETISREFSKTDAGRSNLEISAPKTVI